MPEIPDGRVDLGPATVNSSYVHIGVNMDADNSTEASGLPHSTASLVFICFFAFLSQVLTIGGNILVMLAFRIERRLHKPSNYFLLSLAAADLIIGLFSMPVYSLYLIMDTWPFGSVVCDLWISIDYACSEVSVLNLILISVDRMWSVRSPARYRNKMTIRRAIIMIIPTWVLPILLYFTSVLGWTTFTNTEDTREPGDCYLPFMQESPLFTTISTIFVYWVPLFAIFIMYANIYRIIRNLAKKKKKSREKRPCTALPRPCPDQLQQIAPVETTILETEAPGMVTDTTTTTTTTSTSLSVEPSRPDVVRIANKSIAKRNRSDADSCQDSSDETSSSERRADSTMSAASSRNALESNKGKRNNNNKSTKVGSLKRGHGGSMSGSKRGFRRTRSQRGERQSRSERKATRTLTFILGAFFITWSPYSTIVIIMAWCETCVPMPLYHFSYYLCYINSTINPLCYAFANELFRASFHRILTCQTCRG
ncbi:muscarinic acetylcholine receptor M2-like [Diadema setosum]